MSDTDAPKRNLVADPNTSRIPRWRIVEYHGEPTYDDYPVLVKLRVVGGSSIVHAPGDWVFHDENRWCPIALPVGDEPRPLPAPWRPMSDPELLAGEERWVHAHLLRGWVVTRWSKDMPLFGDVDAWCELGCLFLGGAS